MILEAIINALMLPVEWAISMLPTVEELPSWITDTITLVGYGLQIFPQDVWIGVLVNVLLWVVGLVIWAIVEWGYKKIPGVD